MSKVKKFILKQKKDIESYGAKELLRKLYLLFKVILQIPVDLIAAIPCIAIRLLRPWLIIRIERIPTGTFGNFVHEPSIYYCKKKLKIDQLNKKHTDLVYIHYKDKIYNKQLAKMWKRKLNFLSGYLLAPIDRVNRFFPGWKIHSIPDITTFVPREIEFEIEKCQALEFTSEEEIYGKKLLNKFGLKNNDKFVCLVVRDHAWSFTKPGFRNHDWTYHDYRHYNLDNFLLAAEELTKKGYYVFRMGVVAEKEFKSDNPKIIDYANSNLRNDFMDIFLGAKCSFCISSGLGYEEVPNVFRRPIILLTMPFGDFRSHSDRFFILAKHHYLKKENRRLTLSEIFSYGVAYCYKTENFEKKGVEFVDNTPEEIKDVALEMVEYLEQKKKLNKEEEELQKNFKDLYIHNYKKAIKILSSNNKEHSEKEALNLKRLHSQIRSRYSTQFLKNNRNWLR